MEQKLFWSIRPSPLGVVREREICSGRGPVLPVCPCGLCGPISMHYSHLLSSWKCDDVSGAESRRLLLVSPAESIVTYVTFTPATFNVPVMAPLKHKNI